MDYKEIERVCLGQFESSDLFKTTVKDNIEKHRKGKKTVFVQDQAGNPMAGLEVRVRLKNHEFKHGAHVFMLDQFEAEEENKKYREVFAEYFNLATIPFYWDGIEPTQGSPRYASDSENIYRRPAPDLCLDYCREKGMDAKIHCLFYDKFIPAWLPKTDAEQMRALYEKRFAEIAARYGDGVMYEVEVINELLSTFAWTTNSVISDTRDSLEWSFSLAEKYFPRDVLVINDGNYIPDIGRFTYRHPYYTMIDAALAKGVRIDKIGVQNHIYVGMMPTDKLENYAGFYNPRTILKGLDVLSSFGKPLEITEISIPTFGDGEAAEDLQAEVLKYMYTLWFSSEKVESAVYWNSVEETAYDSPEWNENKLKAGLLHRDLSPKKSGAMLKKLFKEEWHTEVTAQTDQEGCLSFDGFHGDYEVWISGEKADDVRLYKNNQEAKVICSK